MKIALINPPHTAIGSRIPDEQLPPLGLLSIGGPLIDAGHTVKLLDADIDNMPVHDIAIEVAAYQPDAVMVGHSGSSSVHPTVASLTRAVRSITPSIKIVYGGVFPTYAWQSILENEPQIDVIVRGEGELTALLVAEALQSGRSLDTIPGVAFLREGVPHATREATVPVNLDALRIGWELVDLKRYSYWGNRRAVVVQFSRGCPHDCTYCGQQLFWNRWRHRDPVRFAREIADLYRNHGVEVFNFADENPTASRSAWLAFLQALIAENVPVTLVGSTRADDIVRDADILHLYKQAGIARFLLGIESYNEATLEQIRKGSAVANDRKAIQLLRKHGILSMATYVVGFKEETDRDYLRGLSQLLAYDPDQIQLLYATPHHWTAYAHQEADRQVIQTDLRKWDYKHQVLATRHVPSWRVLLWVKLIEAVMQGRPKAIARCLYHSDRSIRAAIRWYYSIGRKVWPYEILNYVFHDHRVAHGPTLAEFQASPAAPYRPPDRTEEHTRLHPGPAQSSGAVCAWALPG